MRGDGRANEYGSESIEIEINTNKSFKLKFLLFAEFAIHIHCKRRHQNGVKKKKKKKKVLLIASWLSPQVTEPYSSRIKAIEGISILADLMKIPAFCFKLSLSPLGPEF